MSFYFFIFLPYIFSYLEQYCFVDNRSAVAVARRPVRLGHAGGRRAAGDRRERAAARAAPGAAPAQPGARAPGPGGARAHALQPAAAAGTSMTVITPRLSSLTHCPGGGTVGRGAAQRLGHLPLAHVQLPAQGARGGRSRRSPLLYKHTHSPESPFKLYFCRRCCASRGPAVGRHRRQAADGRIVDREERWLDKFIDLKIEKRIADYCR